MAFRISGFILMATGAILLAVFESDLVIALAGSSVILGFLIVALDIMRASIKNTQ